MNSVELEMCGRPETPLEQRSNEVILRAVSFVVRNLPDPRFLRRLSASGHSTFFKIGQEEWELKVEKDADDLRIVDPACVVSITKTNSKAGEKYTVGVLTDSDMKYVAGVYFEDGSSTHALGIQPIDLAEMTGELRNATAEKVLRSHRQTQSIPRTSKLQRLRQRRVKSFVDSFRKQGLISS